MILGSVLDVKEQPVVVPIRGHGNLYAATFVLMKLIVGRYMLRRAEELGLLHLDTRVFESTSGTMGLALAFACKESGYPLTLVSDPVLGDRLRRLLECLGAVVVKVPKPAAKGGFQAARLEKLDELRALEPDSYWTAQYDNSANPEAYAPAALNIAGQIKRPIDYLVSPVGSGGNGSGLSRSLHVGGHPARFVAVDTFGSVLFGHKDSHRILRGLGNSLIPANLDYHRVHEVHWVNAAEAFGATLELYSEHQIDQGPTSGAAFLVARWLAERNPTKTVVFVCPDSGERYRDTVYNPDFLAAERLQLPRLPDQPLEVTAPHDVSPVWCRMSWCRRPRTDFPMPGGAS